MEGSPMSVAQINRNSLGARSTQAKRIQNPTGIRFTFSRIPSDVLCGSFMFRFKWKLVKTLSVTKRTVRWIEASLRKAFSLGMLHMKRSKFGTQHLF